MAKGRRKQLERMDRLEALDQKEITPHFRFPAKPLTDAEHLTVKQLAVGYHYPILAGIDFTLKGGQKVVITGMEMKKPGHTQHGNQDNIYQANHGVFQRKRTKGWG